MTDEKERAPSAASERAALAGRAGIVAAGTLVSRVLGVARESVMAACFDAALIDLFVVAFTIPNTLRGLFAEGAASAAFVPVYSDLRAKEGAARAKEFHVRAAGVLMIALAVLSVVGVIAAPALVVAFASGYLEDPARFDQTVALTRVLFPYIFFMGMAALSAGALNANRRFAVPALAPALLNVALIAAPFTMIPIALAMGLPAIGALAIGALVGGALQVIAQWPALARAGLWVRPRATLDDPAVRRAIALLGPVAAGLGVYQVNLMLSRSLASWLPAGSQAYLWFGTRLVEIPQGVFAIAFATALLPTLSDLVARGEHDELRRTFTFALRSMLFVALPASVLLIVLAEPLVTAVYMHGRFGWDETVQTARSLLWQAAGVWAIASVRVVVPVFHAHGDTRTPVIASVVNLVVFAGLGIALSRVLDHVGIAIAISAAGALQLVMLLALLRRKMGRLGLSEVATGTLRIVVACAAMGAASWGIARTVRWDDGASVVDMLVLAGAIAAGGIVYLGAAWVMRAPELDAVLGRVLKRFRRGRATAAR
ncbi:murein biosynthesis integral membrane protein MurJ [Sandaracinus amylolyticus]|uniref:Probable lipid II flippase MurJ n=1 Tax=Sandaracinus amylolyticus TaxID=927083 RepID=A0A0F6SE68_9BACT|nr:murein biosynthesis integral membrane protein MurJ [Sandaracinus amylolyticus]AKF04669.1 putative peptidoglycan lipid II flippase MurJ [Sandaracinus amylolyticus]